MKTFAVNEKKHVVELNFASEDQIEEEFNSILESGMNIGKITDSTGKTFVIDTSYGYSRDIVDFGSVMSRTVSSAITHNF